MIRRLYDWTMTLAEHPRAAWALGFVSFIESSVFPIPPDVLQIPMTLANRFRAWWYAFICTATSVLGGVLGYGIGMFLFAQLGEPLLQLYGYEEKFGEFQGCYDDWGVWVVFVAGITLFPYKVITILSGAAALDPAAFVIASLLARGGRFFMTAWLLWQFGEPVRAFIEKRLQALFVLFCVLVIGGFVAARYLFNLPTLIC